MDTPVVVATLAADVHLCAERCAKDVLATHWPGGLLPVDPVRVAQALGVRVYSANLADAWAVTVGSEAGAEVYVERSQPSSRFRYAVAHALGHHVQDVLDGAPPDASHVDRDEDDAAAPGEVFAHAFAAALLVPADAARTLRVRGDVASAAAFDVPLRVWRTRRDQLRA